MILTKQEQKQRIIEELENLIKDIKTNKKLDDFWYEWKLKELQDNGYCVVRVTEAILTRREVEYKHL